MIEDPSTSGCERAARTRSGSCGGVSDAAAARCVCIDLRAIRVPLHIDPEFAKMAGYDQPFMHGLCTYGFVCRAILESCCGGEPENFKSLSGRFADQVWFGDTIITSIWEDQPGEAIVQAQTQNGAIVISQGKTTFI